MRAPILRGLLFYTNDQGVGSHFCYIHRMLYAAVKVMARLALPLFARRIVITNPERLQTGGPLLLAVNHPNSFLDAILLGAYMRYPVHFITRGDVFKKAWVRRFLKWLNMIPIYRIRDGKEMLSLNEQTFRQGVDVLYKGGILLIFVEGFCENQTTLQLPLKKGGPRMLQACWQMGVPAKVLPVWLQYSSFNRFGKTIHIRLGEVFDHQVCDDPSSAACLTAINTETAKQLQALEHSMPFVHAAPPAWQRGLLALPALLGAVLHAPLYLPVSWFSAAVSRNNVHYDSILLAVLFALYPLLLLAVAGWLWAISGDWLFLPLVLLGMPALAWCFVRWRSDDTMHEGGHSHQAAV